MALQNLAFNELYDSNNTSGRTRVNESGLIVGVDFSSTSNTIGTGSKTFTLTADLNVNRDWFVGGKVIVVDQVGGATMTGTVTTYTPSTQVLVLSIASVTGSGTGLTNWRIGSLDARRNFDPVTLQPVGIVLEGQATNVILQSQNLAGNQWIPSGLSVSPVAGGPLGSSFKLVGGSGANQPNLRYGQDQLPPGSGRYLFVVTAKAAELQFITLAQPVNDAGRGGSVTVNLITREFRVSGTTFNSASVSQDANGFVKIVLSLVVSNNNGIFPYIYLTDTLGTSSIVNPYTGDGTSGVIVSHAELYLIGGELPIPPIVVGSYIPTTTAQVTRTAEILDVNPTRLAELFRQGEGTGYLEFVVNESSSAAGYIINPFGGGTDRLEVYHQLQTLQGAWVANGAVQAGFNLPITIGQTIRLAFAFKQNDFAFSINGGDAVVDTMGIVPVITGLRVGRSGNGENGNANFRKFGIRPNRISNANLKLISAGTLDFFQDGEIL